MHTHTYNHTCAPHTHTYTVKSFYNITTQTSLMNILQQRFLQMKSKLSSITARIPSDSLWINSTQNNQRGQHWRIALDYRILLIQMQSFRIPQMQQISTNCKSDAMKSQKLKWGALTPTVRPEYGAEFAVRIRETVLFADSFFLAPNALCAEGGDKAVSEYSNNGSRFSELVLGSGGTHV